MLLFSLTRGCSFTATAHKLSQHVNSTQGIYCLELLHQFEKCQYPLSICYVSSSVWYIACISALKLTRTSEVEIFTSICQRTEIGIREAIQIVQGYVCLGVNLECEWGYGWWLLHTWSCHDLSDSANWKAQLQGMKTIYQDLWLILSFKNSSGLF